MYDRRQFGNSHRRVLFFIGGYKTKIEMYRPLYWVMRMLGYRVYAYVLDPTTVVSSNIMAYVNQVKAIQQDIKEILNELPDSILAYTMGNSLGSESALYALKHTPQIRATALITTRGAIAEYIWNTEPGKIFKGAYVQKDYDFTQISQELSPVEPTKGLNIVQARPIYISYSLADNVIPVSNTQRLIDQLEENGSIYRIKRYSRGGHLATTLKGLGAFWRWHQLFRQS